MHFASSSASHRNPIVAEFQPILFSYILFKMYYAIFDLDGTLLDFEGASLNAFRSVLAPYDRVFTKELHSAIIGTKDADWSVKVVHALGLEGVVNPESLVRAWHAAIDEAIPTMALMPGAEQLVRQLHASKIPIAIATSSSSFVVPKKLSHHPVLMECVSLIVTGDDSELKAGKPAPDIFLLAAKRLGCTDNSACVVFEDSPFGLLGGIAAGMRTVAIPDRRYLTTESMERDVWQKATLTVGDLTSMNVLALCNL